MGIIICQQCNEIIHYYETEKVTKLYGVCPNCHQQTK